MVFTLSDKNEKLPAKFSIMHFMVKSGMYIFGFTPNDSFTNGGVISLLLLIELYLSIKWRKNLILV